jgi:hypothetical protein
MEPMMTTKITSAALSLAALVERITAATDAETLEITAKIMGTNGEYITVNTTVDDSLDKASLGRPLAWMKLEQEDENDPDAFRLATSAEADRLKAALTFAGYPTITPIRRGSASAFISLCLSTSPATHESVVNNF